MEKFSPPAPSSSPSLEGAGSKIDYPCEYDFIDVAQPPDTNSDDKAATTEPHYEQSDLNDGPVFEFRLFASPPDVTPANATSSTSKTKTTIKLLPSPEVVDIPISEGRFLRPARPKHHYFTSSLSSPLRSELRRQYAASAVSSRDVLQQASAQDWPGTALPWRVINVTVAKDGLNSGPSGSEPLAPGKYPAVGSGRKKPNKKRRIQLRKLLLARTAAANAKVRQTETAEEKEKALREKKTAKNRKIQLKRREKERQKKTEVKAAASTDVAQAPE